MCEKVQKEWISVRQMDTYLTNLVDRFIEHGAIVH